MDTSREKQDDQRDRYGPDADPTAFQGLIQRILGIVGVRSDKPPESTQETTVVVVVVLTNGVVKVLRVGSWSFVCNHRT